jgi:hypothetical protein
MIESGPARKEMERLPMDDVKALTAVLIFLMLLLAKNKILNF